MFKRIILVVGLVLTVVLTVGTSAALATKPALEQRVAALEAQVDALTQTVSDLSERLAAVEQNHVLDLGPFVSVQGELNGVTGPNIVFQGANVHVRSTDTEIDESGLGNLIVGWNDISGSPLEDRSGSNNLVVGNWNSFSGTGCFVAGQLNLASGYNASVSGGGGNVASGQAASVSGGRENEASGSMASVSGGLENLASGQKASVSGGQLNIASAEGASVSGGYGNSATADMASVSGGHSNVASGLEASVSGGASNEASGEYASVSGGNVNFAQGKLVTISGGSQVTLGVLFGWAAGTPGSSDAFNRAWFLAPLIP